MKNKRGSRRADLLERVLKHINYDNYCEVGELEGDVLIFGYSSPYEMINDLVNLSRKSPKEEAIVEWAKELAGDLKLHDGKVEAESRTTLNKPQEFKTKAWDILPPEQRPPLKDLIDKAMQQRTPSKSEVADSLDAVFAQEVIGKLPKIIDGASTLDALDLDRTSIPDKVKGYFDEAHCCYLYGFHVACAVLCRAILESSLVEVIDPHGRIEHLLVEEMKKSGKPKQSYIGRLLEEAANQNILTDDRPKCAIEVRNAGNDAIHDYAKFEKRLQDPFRGIANIVDSTRKVLIDLYSERG
ncbi:MAG TPA: DUF4145 domain-containing protein [Terriglobia bacterium]|nr:DUF4145 domain-containing protein [Terriglobia bacterium]